MKVKVEVETDKVVESMGSAFVEGIATEVCERAHLVSVQQELQRELDQRRALLIQFQEPSLIKDTEEQRRQQLEAVLKGGESARDEHTARQRNVAQLRTQQLLSAMRVTMDMKSIGENYKNTFQEYSNSNMARNLPELVERERRLAEETEGARDKYERLRDSYLCLETSPGDAHRAQALLNNTLRRRERAERVRAARLELQRLWYFAPPSSLCPRLLHDTPQRYAL